MKIAIFGLGYVGSVSAGCLAAAGHQVIGVDVDPHKLSMIQSGRAPVSEPDLDALLARMVQEGRLTATSDTAAPVRACELSLVCVGTPSRRNGSLDSTYLERVMADIGAALRDSPSYHVVAVRSTVLPGVVAGRLIPILEQASGRRAGVDFGVCVNPEFLREGSAIKDFERPPFTVIGALDARSADVLAGVYAHLEAPVRRVLPDEASMVKYASNIFHAMKVTFANEIGAMCHELGVDGQAVMGIFCEDRELNISTRYLRPGFAFGGSCLPKDLRAMSYVAKANDISVPLVNSVIPSNDAQIARVADLVLESRKRVTMLGLSFKEGSDDLRESPFVRLAEALIGKGVALRIYDPDVAISDVFGRNRAYLEEHLPHVGRLMGTDITDALSNAELVIVCKRVRGIDQVRALTSDHVTLIDLVGLPQLGDALRPWAAAPDATGATTVPAAH